MPRRLFRRARTAASLPGRVVACEDRCTALETEVAQRIAEMRFELGEIRAMLTAQLDAEADSTELLGRLLRSTATRLDHLEETVSPAATFATGAEQPG